MFSQKIKLDISKSYFTNSTPKELIEQLKLSFKRIPIISVYSNDSTKFDSDLNVNFTDLHILTPSEYKNSKIDFDSSHIIILEFDLLEKFGYNLDDLDKPLIIMLNLMTENRKREIKEQFLSKKLNENDFNDCNVKDDIHDDIIDDSINDDNNDDSLKYDNDYDIIDDSNNRDTKHSFINENNQNIESYSEESYSTFFNLLKIQSFFISSKKQFKFHALFCLYKLILAENAYSSVCLSIFTKDVQKMKIFCEVLKINSEIYSIEEAEKLNDVFEFAVLIDCSVNIFCEKLFIISSLNDKNYDSLNINIDDMGKYKYRIDDLLRAITPSVIKGTKKFDYNRFESKFD